MLTNRDFDELSRKAFSSNSTLADQDELWMSVFALPEWNFIARGAFPNVRPYIASREDTADGRYMIRAFTDTERLYRFAEENRLLEINQSSLILAIPTKSVITYLEQFVSQGVHGIWFNSDNQSSGFFCPLAQLRPIKTRLENLFGRYVVNDDVL